MRLYDIVLVFKDTPATQREKVLESVKKWMGDVKILKTEDWGKKRLAYQIEKQDEGYYVVLNVQANNALLPDFEKRLVNEESLLRHLVLKKN